MLIILIYILYRLCYENFVLSYLVQMSNGCQFAENCYFAGLELLFYLNL